MFRRLFRNAARKFGARYDYDVGYMEDLAELSPGGFAKLALLTPFTQERFGVPAAPYYAAKFIAARTAGCGPCAMLVVRMAEEAGVSAQQLASIARPGSADADMRLAADYATAVLANSFDLADMIETARSRFGEKGLWGLASAVAAGQFYPTLKRGVGAALSCDLLPAEFREVA
ncbi:hypothetical protein [Rhizobium redzepovicii]|uniref:hypothetical protein n=1 Tax=Rhizobium redzepovicii TaxID=2867518 RepID=UPI00287216A4|nr:hypothetical protein [Rhizobium redzepovicii]MDR9780658.1 hypothetical protein [Rhizobium redzepovicii]